MSTKCTLAYGDGWHLYEECFGHTIHLQLTGDIVYTCSPTELSLMLPRELLEGMKEYLSEIYQLGEQGLSEWDDGERADDIEIELEDSDVNPCVGCGGSGTFDQDMKIACLFCKGSGVDD